MVLNYFRETARTYALAPLTGFILACGIYMVIAILLVLYSGVEGTYREPREMTAQDDFLGAGLVVLLFAVSILAVPLLVKKGADFKISLRRLGLAAFLVVGTLGLLFWWQDTQEKVFRELRRSAIIEQPAHMEGVKVIARERTDAKQVVLYRVPTAHLSPALNDSITGKKATEQEALQRHRHAILDMPEAKTALPDGSNPLQADMEAYSLDRPWAPAAVTVLRGQQWSLVRREILSMNDE